MHMNERRRPEHHPEKLNPEWPEPRVGCAQCLREVPKSEATVREAQDYVLFFCGEDCYAAWQRAAARDK
jgi:hypothetical protein